MTALETPWRDEDFPNARWLEFRRKLDRVMREGVWVSSVGHNWHAYDTGKGVATSGVNTCVAVATTEQLGHIPADRTTDAREVQIFLDTVAVRKGEIHVFGLRDSKLMQAVLKHFERAGLKPVIHFNDDRDSAFNIVVEKKQIDFYQE